MVNGIVFEMFLSCFKFYLYPEGDCKWPNPNRCKWLIEIFLMGETMFWDVTLCVNLVLTYLFSLYFRSSNGRVRVGQEHKIVEVKGLEFYSRMFHGSMDLVNMNNMGNSYSANSIRSEGKHYYSILAPCDVTLILSVRTSWIEPPLSIIPYQPRILLLFYLWL